MGGTIITANSYANDQGGYCDPAQNNCNGETFCVSSDNGGNLNWWSAFLWCQTNNGTLASFYEVCPGTRLSVDTTTRGYCANLTGNSINTYLWLKEQANSGYAYRFLPYNGYVTKDVKRSPNNRAICVN